MLLIFLKPIVGFYLTIAFAPIWNVIFFVFGAETFVDSLLLIDGLVLLPMAGYLLMQAINPEDDKRGNFLASPFFIFLAFSTFSLIWTNDLKAGCIELVKLGVAFLICCLSTLLVTSKESFRKAINLWIIVGVFIAVGVIVSVIIGEQEQFKINISDNLKMSFVFISIPGKFITRGGGFMPVDVAAMYLKLPIILAFATFYATSGFRRKGILFLCTIFLTFALICTGSRGGLISFIVQMAFFFLINRNFRKNFIKSSVLFIALVIIIYGLTTLFLSAGLIERTSHAFVMGDEGSPLSFRFKIWEKGFETLIDSYGIANGIGGFQKYIGAIPGAHSFYLSILFDLGFVGFFIFIWIVANLIIHINSALKICIDSYHRIMLEAITAGLFGYGVHSLIDTRYTDRIVWVFLSLGLISVNLINKDMTNLKKAKTCCNKLKSPPIVELLRLNNRIAQ